MVCCERIAFLFVLIYIFLLPKMKAIGDFVFYASQIQDSKAIKSSVDHSLDTYRQNLAKLMINMDMVLLHTSKLDDILNLFADIHCDWKIISQKIPSLHEHNEIIAQTLLRDNIPKLAIGILSKPAHSYFPQDMNHHTSNTTSSYTSIQQLFIHLSRDWGDIGEKARRDIYQNGIIAALSDTLHHMSSSSTGEIQVLVPGAGLGRLALEIASLNLSSELKWNVEANEFSGPMVHAINAMLTEILPSYARSQQSYSFYPFLHFEMMDEWDYSARMKPSQFPSIDVENISSWIMKPIGTRKFTVQYGDFLRMYGEESRRNTFDVLVTCFFIDTFDNIIEPLLVIQHALKPGGLWVNAGPLHYHGKPAIPYSYAQLEQVISRMEFTKVYNKIINSNYFGEDANYMKPQTYNFPLCVWKKNNVTDKEEEESEKESYLQKLEKGKQKNQDTSKKSIENKFIMI